MPWKPLPTDVPLDHEALPPPPDTPATAAAADGSGFAPLPDNAPLDQAPPEQTPAIIAAVRPGASPRSDPALKAAGKEEMKPEEVNPRYTEQGFDLSADQRHSGLTEADKREYASFFNDPKKPPSAAMLRQWYHEKTGALMGNADDIVNAFKSNGQFSTDEQVITPKPKTGKADAYFDHTGNALAFDYGPEVAAALQTVGIGGDGPNIWNADDQSLHNLWANNADMLHARLDAESEQHPFMSGGGELTGVAAMAPLTGAAGDAAKLAKAGETNRALLQGAAEGMVYGSGAAGPGHRLEGAASGAALVPVVGAAAKVPLVVARGAKSVLEGSPGLARRIIAKAIKEDMNTPESVGAAIGEANANGVPMALGDTGENVRGLMAASARASGVGRTVVRDALEQRQSALADRVTGAIERDLGPIANPHKVADDLMAQANAKAGPLYDRAYAAPGVQNFVDKVAPLLQRPSMKKALSNAYRIAQEEGENPETLGFSKIKPSDSPILDASGKPMQVDEVQLANVPSWKTLDYVKRGMDDVVEGYRDPTSGKLNLDTEGRATNNTLRSYLSAFDAANPDYAAARAAYAGPVKGIGAMNTGRKFLNMTADDIEARMRDMSPFEKDMAGLGARRAMAELVSSKGDTADVVNALVGTGKKRAMMARLFGDRKTFQRFVDTLGQEREGWRSYRQALLGSPTASNVQDDRALETAAMAADFAAGGMPVATATSKALKLVRFKLGEKAQQQIAALLSNTDSSSIRELAAELSAKAEKRGIVIRRSNNAVRQVGKGAVVLHANP